MNTVHLHDTMADNYRLEIRKLLGFPTTTCSLAAECRETILIDEQVEVEKWIFQSEEGLFVPALFYKPRHHNTHIPAVVMANGHGGSKNSAYAQYTGQLYAKMGIGCLLHDTIGEEERHREGQLGTRAHDAPDVIRRADRAGRLIMGKMVWDAMRAVDFVSEYPGVDSDRLGVVGNSLGGTVATWLLALDPRLKAGIISGSGYADDNAEVCKPCTSVPLGRLLQQIGKHALLVSLTQPHAAVLSMNGTLDDVITQGREDYWAHHEETIDMGLQSLEEDPPLRDRFQIWYDPDGGHRAYHLHKDALLWMNQHFSLNNEQFIRELPEITLEDWFAKHGLVWPQRDASLYWVPVHHRGAIYADLNIRPIPREQLTCLHADESGHDRYTLEGWLTRIEQQQNVKG